MGLKKQLILVALSAAVGLTLLYFSGVGGYDPSGCGGCLAHGRPAFWMIMATGFGQVVVNWDAVAIDFVFWFGLSLAGVQLSSILVTSVLDRRMGVSKSALTYG